MGDTDTWGDTVDTTDTDIPVLTDTTTTTARGLLMLNLKPNPKPKLMPPLMLGTDTMAVLTDITGMAEDTMVDTTDTVMDTDTDTTVKKTFIECNILPFFKQPPFGAFETYTTALCNITETVFFMKKLLQNSYLDPIVIKNSQKMPLSKKKGPVQHHPYYSLVMISNYYPRL